METGPYKTPESKIAEHSPSTSERPVFQFICSSLLLLISIFCFYAGYHVSELSAGVSENMVKLEELSLLIKTKETKLERETLLKYFESNIESTLLEIQALDAATGFYILFGIVLIFIAIAQLYYVILALRKR